MERVSHLWNLTSFLSKTQPAEANKLRTHYIQCCREAGNNYELPKHIFGPGAMCGHCGTLWSKVNTTVRLSKSRYPSRSIKKSIARKAKGNSDLSNYKRKLVDKSIKNQVTNKLVITCSVCNEKTTVEMTKPKREKIKGKLLDEAHPEIQPIGSQKKKKKKSRDKTAGLIINQSTNKNAPKIQTPSPIARSKINTPPIKVDKINIKKLKGMIDTTITPNSKKPNLHSFLTELK